MNTHHLATFFKVATVGSITRAAEDMRISQPAVSAQIKRLEEDFGVPLISQRGRGIALTDAGRTLFEYAEAMLGLESQALRVMNEFRKGQRGRIVVGASPVIGMYTLPRHIASFQKLHKNFEVELQLHLDSGIERLVQEGHIDIGVTLTPPNEHFALRVTRFVEDAWIGIEPPYRVEHIPVFLARDGVPSMIQVPQANIQLQDSTETVKRFVQEGTGRAIVLRSSVLWELQQGSIRVWSGFPEQTFALSLVSRPAERLGVSRWSFIHHLLKSCKIY